MYLSYASLVIQVFFVEKSNHFGLVISENIKIGSSFVFLCAISDFYCVKPGQIVLPSKATHTYI